MSGITKATLSFNSLPTIKVDGKKQEFDMVRVNGKNVLGVALGNGTFARLKTMPGGKFEVDLIRQGKKDLSGVNVKVVGGTVSRIRTSDGETVRSQPGVKAPSGKQHLQFNEKFAESFTRSGEKVSAPQDREAHLAQKIEERLKALEDLNKRPRASLMMDQALQINRERRAIKMELNRLLDKQEELTGYRPQPKVKSQDQPPITISSGEDEPEKPKRTKSSPPKVSISVDQDVDEPDLSPKEKRVRFDPTVTEISNPKPSQEQQVKALSQQIKSLKKEMESLDSEVATEKRSLLNPGNIEPSKVNRARTLVDDYSRFFEQALDPNNKFAQRFADGAAEGLKKLHFGDNFDAVFAPLKDAITAAHEKREKLEALEQELHRLQNLGD